MKVSTIHLEKTVSQIQDLLRQIREKEISTYAASAAFFILLAGIPFLMFLLTLIRFTEIHALLLDYAEQYIPETLLPLLRVILGDIENNSSIALLSVTVLTALYSASKGVFALMRGMNAIYGTEDDRNFILRRIIAVAYTLLLTLLLVLTCALLVAAKALKSLLLQTVPGLIGAVRFLLNIRLLTMALILLLFFLLIYKVFPNRQDALLHQLPGAVFSTAGWLLFSCAFSIYIEHFANYSRMYGSLTAVILSMLWMYILMYIVFLGAMLNTLCDRRFHTANRKTS